MFLDDLNDSQRAAVVSCDAPSLVIAGAGSGKTRVLTYKIAYLLDQGFKPWNILALTFTNKAAGEMRQRISELVGADNTQNLWMGTFHSIFSKILRIDADMLGYTADFTIYDAQDSKSLIKQIVKDMSLDDKKYKPGVVASRISMAKNSLILPSAYRLSKELRDRDNYNGIGAVADIYERYMIRCKQSNAMDFDDLLLNTWLLFTQHPEIAEKYQERFQYVLVDEYQDTNYAQHQIVWLITNARQRVCAVGDDAQSIYSFRGANIDNILNFRNTYKDVKLFKLEQNYRSTQTIVSAANSLIHHNERQIHKDVFSLKDVGSPISVYQAYSDLDEANIVTRKVRSFADSLHIDYNRIAVLYRTNAQSRSLEDSLRKAGIPYRIWGGLSFYQRKEVKDCIAYFRLAVNPYDEEALRRIINVPARGIGQTTLDKVFGQAMQDGVAPWQILEHYEQLPVNNGIKTRLAKFVTMINAFNAQIATQDAYLLGLRILAESEYQAEVFHGTEPEDITRQENLQELLDGMSAFVQEKREQGESCFLSDFLQEVSLLTDQDNDDDDDKPRVTLMTVHAAKGLEFAVVFVVGMEETLFPNQMSMDTPREIEEERRLFYVAMTRAEQYLVLTHARSRMRYGSIEESRPSRFLKEIDSKFLKHEGFSNTNPQPKLPSQRSISSHPFENMASRTSFGSNAPHNVSQTRPSVIPGGFKRVSSASHAPAPTVNTPQLQSGTRIAHERFGVGVVQKVEGAGLDAKATVQFENAGVKQLLLRFAKFKVL